VNIVIKQIYVAALSLSLLAPLSALASWTNGTTVNGVTSNSLTSNATQAAGMGLVSSQVKAVNGVLVLR
jgi:hypothetical protein